MARGVGLALESACAQWRRGGVGGGAAGGPDGRPGTNARESRRGVSGRACRLRVRARAARPRGPPAPGGAGGHAFTGSNRGRARPGRLSRLCPAVRRPGARPLRRGAGVSLHHRFDGGGRAPTLVLSNSLATTLELWDDNVAALVQRYRILRYDHRGHGRSPVPAGPYTVEELAEDVLQLIDELGLERVSFCGLSLGGAVGMALALRVPERLERLVLCCTSAQFAPPEKWLERARTARSDGLEPLVDGTLGRWFTPTFRTARPEAVARLRDQFLATPPEGYAACGDPGRGARGGAGRGASRQRRAPRGVRGCDPGSGTTEGGRMSDPLHDRGMATRRKVLGDEHVDAA